MIRIHNHAPGQLWLDIWTQKPLTLRRLIAELGVHLPPRTLLSNLSVIEVAL